ncbi:MAG: MlaD family protein [Pseudomonadota bacterium]
MTGSDWPSLPPDLDIPDALVVPLARRGRLSWIWLIPLVAALIGGWLVVRSILQQGPVVTLVFKSGEGIEANKTRIRYKEVEVGRVQSVQIGPDRSQVVVQAELNRDMIPHLNNKTHFWVVRPKFSGGEIRGLTTLFSGAYIGMDPGDGSESSRDFIGLDEAPIVKTYDPGREFVIQASDLGSLDTGSPVLFKGIKVGQVTSHNWAMDGSSVDIQIFVHRPYDQFVRQNTHFWNASGLRVSASASGFEVEMASVTSLLVGGIAFDTIDVTNTGDLAEPGQRFLLYPSRKALSESRFSHRSRYLAYFEGSLSGLEIGALVEFRGIRIGEVVNISLEYEPQSGELQVAVQFEIETDRIHFVGGGSPPSDPRQIIDSLVAKGLRAEPRMASLLTGKLSVNLDFHPDLATTPIDYRGDVPRFPAVASKIDRLTGQIQGLLEKADHLPIEEIGQNLLEATDGAAKLLKNLGSGQTVQNLNETLRQGQQLAQQLNRMSPTLQATLDELNRVLQATHRLLAPSSTLQQQLLQLILEWSSTGRALRSLAEYLERHPEALLRGKR